MTCSLRWLLDTPFENGVYELEAPGLSTPVPKPVPEKEAVPGRNHCRIKDYILADWERINSMQRNY
jgi:hypothetical protein